MLLHILKMVSRKEIMCFSLLVVVFMCLYFGQWGFIVQNYKPDYYIQQIKFYDIINSKEKLEIVSKSSNIHKEFNPRLGDLIAKRNNSLELVCQEAIMHKYTKFTLSNRKMLYSNEYEYVENLMAISKTKLKAKRIKNISDLIKVRYLIMDKSIYGKIKIGDFLWQSNKFTYIVIPDRELLKKEIN